LIQLTISCCSLGLSYKLKPRRVLIIEALALRLHRRLDIRGPPQLFPLFPVDAFPHKQSVRLNLSDDTELQMKMNVGIFPTRLNFDQRMRLPGRQLADDVCWQEAEVARRDREPASFAWINRFV